jgi:hypothetical protein
MCLIFISLQKEVDETLPDLVEVSDSDNDIRKTQIPQLKIFRANWCQLTDWRQLPNIGCPYISTPNGAIYQTLTEYLHGLRPIAKAFEDYSRTVATFIPHIYTKQLWCIIK